jgi:hypothetical protein
MVLQPCAVYQPAWFLVPAPATMSVLGFNAKNGREM